MSDQDPAEEGLASPINDWNAQIIAEFRANAGQLGGGFEGAPVLLLHTTGARSGKERVNPMMYLEDAGRIFVFASKAGADTHPDWFRNLVANPAVSAEIGTETIRATAVSLEGDERDRVFDLQKSRYPGLRRVRGEDQPDHPGRRARPRVVEAHALGSRRVALPPRRSLSVTARRYGATMPPELEAIEAAVRASWSKDTCDPDDLVDWSAKNPARGQCGATALTVNDLLGGDLLLAEVHHDDGTRVGFHYWNVLPDGMEVDLTREQFRSEEHVQAPRVVKRPPGPRAARRRSTWCSDNACSRRSAHRAR